MKKKERKYERVLITLPPMIYDKLEAHRENIGADRSTWIAEAVREKLERDTEDPELVIEGLARDLGGSDA